MEEAIKVVILSLEVEVRLPQQAQQTVSLFMEALGALLVLPLH
jgi:hypothetical protein